MKFDPKADRVKYIKFLKYNDFKRILRNFCDLNQKIQMQEILKSMKLS